MVRTKDGDRPNRIATDGGKPPGEDVHIAKNFDKGGVWFRLGNRRRLLLRPDVARALADKVDSNLDTDAFDAAGYDSSAYVDTLRDAADDVEAANPDPDHDDFDEVPLSDGGRPPLSSFDHAPDVGPSDVDKCGECGRYAPHAFDHAAECSRFDPIDDADSVTPSASNNSRMVRPATDGGDTRFDKPPKRPEQIASSIVAASVGDDVAVFTSHDDTLSIYEGEVVSTGYKDDDETGGGTHVVAIDVAGDRVAVHFDRVITDDWELGVPDPVLFDPVKGARLPVTRFEAVDA